MDPTGIVRNLQKVCKKMCENLLSTFRQYNIKVYIDFKPVTDVWKKKNISYLNFSVNVWTKFSFSATSIMMVLVRHMTGTGSGLLEEIPRVVVQISALTKRATIGVRAPYATRRKLRYEANQEWMNTTFISQGPQSSGI